MKKLNMIKLLTLSTSLALLAITSAQGAVTLVFPVEKGPGAALGVVSLDCRSDGAVFTNQTTKTLTVNGVNLPAKAQSSPVKLAVGATITVQVPQQDQPGQTFRTFRCVGAFKCPASVAGTLGTPAPSAPSVTNIICR